MSKWLCFCRKGLIFGVACGLAMIAFAGHAARAGSGNVTIFISETGKTSFDFDFTSALAAGVGDMNHVLADTTPGGALNSTLDALGYDFNFNLLGANANAPGAGGLATLFLTGVVFRTTPGADATIRIDVSQDTYLANVGLAGKLTQAPSANYTSAPAGNNQLGTSYFNTSNMQNDTSGTFSSTSLTFTSTGVLPNSHPAPGEPGSSPPDDVPSTPAFSLTGRLDITLSGTGGLNPPTDQFTLSTAVASVVPEPASIALMGMGLPVVIVGLSWLRRRKAAA